MKFPELPPLHLPQTAQHIQDFWQQQGIVQHALRECKERPLFVFYEGPPSANGAPGIHHVLSRTIKDLFCRYKTQQGFWVRRKGGWDTHGLPVELAVEKSLDITKEDIGKKISVEAYNAQCRQAVLQHKDQWDMLTTQMGYWLDTASPYLTFDRNYMESIWHLLKQLYNKKLLYKGYTIQPYSPAAGTSLSTQELNFPGCYKLVKDTAVVAQFRVEGTAQDYFLAWTTTPWTLPANSALAVGKEIDYVKVRTFNPYSHQPIQVILAQAVVRHYFPHDPATDTAVFAAYRPNKTPIPWQIIARFKGKDLIGKKYVQLLPYVVPSTPAFRVIAGDFVTTEEGTGIVHIAPTFGAEDLRVAQQANIPPITVLRGVDNRTPIVDPQGRFVPEITDFAGQYVKAAYAPDEVRQQPGYQPADVLLTIQLKKTNKAFRVAKHEHNYPHCWRTDKPILYYPLDNWLIKTTACKERLIALNKTIDWQPAATGTGRFGNWLENLVDWNLSRDRYWGTPLPIWRTKDQQEEKCIGSLEELRKEVDQAVAAGLMKASLPYEADLHRPYVDHIVLVSPSGQPMYREPDLVDVWFESGAMPYAQWHYPFENKAEFEQHFPADFVAEGVDQTRGWFFTLHVLAVLLFDSVAFRQVVANGLVLDAQGNKMSKRLGNTADPFEIMKQYGPDALRWYMISNAQPWDNLKFDTQGLTEITRRFFMTLHNTYGFFALYANIDQFDPTTSAVSSEKQPEIDKWILSRLHSLVQKVTVNYEAYSPTPAARAIQDFVVDDLSNWYVRLNRKRFWKSGSGPDKQAAYRTLYACLKTVIQLAAPIAPFYTEQLYQALHHGAQQGAAFSVHLAKFPVAQEKMIDLALENKMQQAQKVVSLAHSLRKKHQLKVRQPLSTLLLLSADSTIGAQLTTLAPLIQAEVNVKQITNATDPASVVTKKVRPNFKSLGKRYGRYLGALARAIVCMSQEAILQLEQKGELNLTLNHFEPSYQKLNPPPEFCLVQEAFLGKVVITLADVHITSKSISGWAVASEGGITVALNTTLDDALRREGLARDLVSRLQNLRKDQGLAVQDKIRLTLATQDPFVRAAIQQHQAYVSEETQALQLAVVDDLVSGITLELDGYTVQVHMTVKNSNPMQ